MTRNYRLLYAIEETDESQHKIRAAFDEPASSHMPQCYANQILLEFTRHPGPASRVIRSSSMLAQKQQLVLVRQSRETLSKRNIHSTY